MSQAKVDKYKAEKKNRSKILKRKKIKKVILVLLAALFVGAGIGYPLGKKIYKVSYEERKANATISADAYNYWSLQYWNENYYGIAGGGDSMDSPTATETDAE